MWTFDRYRQWMEAQTRWYSPSEAAREAPDTESRLPEARAPREQAPTDPGAAPEPAAPADVLDIQGGEEDLSSILKQLRR
jgi:hypothetical protein